jgi:hypothetical protein
MSEEIPSRREADKHMALLAQSVETLVESNGEEHSRIFKKVECIDSAIKGTTKEPGIFTRLALHDASLTRVWWFLGGVSMALMVAVIKIVWDHSYLGG